MNDRDARQAWTALAEPGDKDAGAVLGALGAARSLELVRDARALVAELSDFGIDVDDRRVQAAVARWRPRLDRLDVTDQRRRAERSGARFIAPGDAEWPLGWDDLDDHAPLGAWVRGDATRLCSAAGIAVVGARAATGYGEHVTGELVGDLAGYGATVVSGAAYGIDGAAHRAALATGSPTVAVLAGGVDRVYPAGHAGLLADILRSGGAVVSEVPPGAEPTRWRFLARNRLIAALAAATVVVEAGWRSGSLNTAGQPARVLLYVRCLLISWVGCTVPAQQRLARPRRSGSAAAGHQRSRPNASGRTSAASCRSTSGGTGKRALQQTQQQAQPRAQQQAQPRAQQRPRSGSAVVAARQHSKHRRDTPERSFLL